MWKRIGMIRYDRYDRYDPPVVYDTSEIKRSFAFKPEAPDAHVS